MRHAQQPRRTLPAGFGPRYQDAPSGRQWANGTQTHMDSFPLFPTINASPTSTVRCGAGWRAGGGAPACMDG